MKLVAEGVAPQGAWFCPEAFKPAGKDYRSIAYHEIRCLVFGSIVNGATGIVPYKIGNPKAGYYQNAQSGIFETPDMRLGYLQGIGPELKGLEDVLLEPKRLPVATNNNHVIAMRKKHLGGEFVIAVNTMPDEYDCGIIGADLPDGAYRVLGENRTIVIRDGKLNDHFSGFATHIYTNDSTFLAPVDLATLTNEISKAKAASQP